MRFTFKEESEFLIKNQQKVSVESLSSFLFDLSLLHDCLVLSTMEEYSAYKFSQFFYYRKGRPIKKEHKLYLNKINHDSPLGLEVIIPLAASVAGIPWLFLQSVQKIQNWKLERRKLELGIEIAELDVKEKRHKIQNEELDLEGKLLNRNALETWNRILSRIENNSFSAIDVDIDFVKHDENE